MGDGYRGFTLAEVLITLGIIGVVAALTLPTLIQNFKKQETLSRLKKFYSVMSQAVELAEIEQGSKSFEWDINSYDVSVEALDDPDSEHEFSYNYFQKYFAKYLKVLKIEKGVYDKEKEQNNLTKIYFQDGSTATIHVGHCIDIDFDINGDKNLNTLGIDTFKFLISTKSTFRNGREHEMKRGYSFSVGWLPIYNTREIALSKCKEHGAFCATLLYLDGWDFKDDYPYKL